MARIALAATLKNSFVGDNAGRFSFQSGAAAPQPSQTAVEAAIAVLEADGASPTQGHVNSLRTAWNTLVSSLNTYGGPDILLDINTSTVTTQSAARSGIRSLEHLLAGSGLAP